MLVALGLLSCGVLCALLVAELTLRAIGFRFQTFPTIQFGWPDPTVIASEFVADRDLFWVPRDYERTLAEARRHHPGIVFMGDSCTMFGTYPRETLALLGARKASVQTGVKLGVAGWSTVQGLAQLTRDVLPLGPRVVTIYFGWNDHWMAFGAPDAEGRPGPLAFWLFQHSRLAQLYEKVKLSRMRPDGRSERVDLATYRANLARMAELSQANGIVPIFITAPSGHEPGHEPVYLAARHLRRLSDLVPLHQRYVQATRDVARERGAVLCDAADAFRHLRPPLRHYFMDDGIHLAPPGNDAMAQIVAGCVIEATSRQ